MKITPLHIIDNCIQIQCLWELLENIFLSDIILLSLTPQIAIFRQLDEVNNNNLLSHVLFIIKWNIHKLRGKLSIMYAFWLTVYQNWQKKKKIAEPHITKMVHLTRKPFISDTVIQCEKQLFVWNDIKVV